MKTHAIRLLVLGLLLAVGLAPGSASPAAAVRAPAPAQQFKTVMITNAIFESRVITLTNQRRAAHGCAPLRINTSLRAAARKHSYAMGRARTLSHQLPGEPWLGRRATLAGYTGWVKLAENVAVGQLTPSGVVRAWMRSPAHRRNILDCSLRGMGVGVVLVGLRHWWTQDFGRR